MSICRRSSWRSIALLLCGLGAQPALAGEVALGLAESRAAAPLVDWRPEMDGKLRFRGVVDPDQSQTGGAPMMYPAPNLVGFLAAVLTHAAINEGVQRSRQQELETRADRVLQPYRPLLDSLDSAALLAELRVRLQSPGSGFDASRPLQLQPLFWMTQDRRALIADVVATRPGDRTSKPWVMRLVSEPLQGEDVEAAWLAQEGLAFRLNLLSLLTEASLRLQREMQGQWSAAAQQRTRRYLEGGRERIERVQVLAQECRRALWRTLRGELLSVPVADAAACQPAEASSDTAVSAPS